MILKRVWMIFVNSSEIEARKNYSGRMLCSCIPLHKSEIMTHLNSNHDTLGGMGVHVYTSMSHKFMPLVTSYENLMFSLLY